MEGVGMPYRIMALLNRRMSNFEAMSRNNDSPGLECILNFFIELEQAASEELPHRSRDVSIVCQTWAGKGIAAAERNAGSEINWASPCIRERLFQELGTALGVN
jgi:hypothetical protein